MTDSAKQLAAALKRFRDFSLEDIDAFFEEKGISHACPACSSLEGWVTYKAPSGVPALVISAGDSPDLLGAPVETLTMRCRHCGHLRLFDLAFFMNWKHKHER